MQFKWGGQMAPARRAGLRPRLARILTILLLPLAAQGFIRPIIGIYGGASVGTSWEFGWHERGRSSDYEAFDLHIGAFVQFDLSRHLGWQVNANYQNGIKKMRWVYSVPGPVYTSRERFGVYSLSLNAVYSVSLGAPVELFLLGGGGLSGGAWEGFEGLYYHLQGGPGARIFLRKRDSGPALIVGATFNALFDKDEWDSSSAAFFRFWAGVEIR